MGFRVINFYREEMDLVGCIKLAWFLLCYNDY